MQKHPLYFDWAASAPPDADIIQEAVDISVSCYANPSSLHKAGREAREKLEEARNRCASVLGVHPDTLFFTSGGTEADQIILLSFLNRPAAGNMLISSIEHPAVREQARMLERCGWEIRELPASKTGHIETDAVISRTDSSTAAVFIMAVNNETGAIQPVRETAEALSNRPQSGRRVWIHTDCVQAMGKTDVSLAEWGVDSAAFSAHKIGGPRGIGLLYAAHRPEPFITGGGQEKGIRSGTENLMGAWALSRCMEKSHAEFKQRSAAQISYTQEFIAELKSIGGCTLIPAERNGGAEERHFSPWIVQASFRGIPGEVMVRALSEQDIYISAGSACSSKKKNRPVLDAMHVSSDEAQNAVRFSFGPSTTLQEMKTLAAAAARIAAMLSR